MGPSKRSNRILVYNIQVFLATMQLAATYVMAASPTWHTVLCTYWLRFYFWGLLMTIHETGCSRRHYWTLVGTKYIGCIAVRRLHASNRWSWEHHFKQPQVHRGLRSYEGVWSRLKISTIHSLPRTVENRTSEHYCTPLTASICQYKQRHNQHFCDDHDRRSSRRGLQLHTFQHFPTWRHATWETK